AERFESFALQVEQVLLAHRSSRRDRAAADHLCDFVPNLHVVVADVLALSHQVDTELQRRQNVFARGGDIGAHRWWSVAFAHQLRQASGRCHDVRVQCTTQHTTGLRPDGDGPWTLRSATSGTQRRRMASAESSLAATRDGYNES